MSPERTDGTAEYKALIDDLVQLASACVAADRLQRGVEPLGQLDNKTLAGLEVNQRSQIAELLRETRGAAIHDVLVHLTDCNYQISLDGVTLPLAPYGPFGTGACFDFVCRQSGDIWPDERPAQPDTTEGPA